MILFNPVVISVIAMCVLCLLRFNVLLSIIVAAVIGGLVAGMPLWDATDSGKGIIDILINGMGGNSATALSYILLGAFAVGLAQSGLATILTKKISKVVSGKKFLLIYLLAIVACFSQNLIPVHIAFIPILIPPLLPLMNNLKIDRRAVACALTFGLKAPYVTIPIGFGLIFHEIIQKNLAANGVDVSLVDVSSAMWIAGLSMVVGLILCVSILYRKDRDYKNILVNGVDDDTHSEMTKEAWGALAGAIVTAVVSIITKSLPYSAIAGLAVMIATGCIKLKKLDDVMDGGIRMMGFIAFVMLVASGYGNVLRESGGIVTLVEATVGIIGGSKILGAILMLSVGLLVTIGIGTSFGTIPIIAAIYCPLAAKLGFSPAAIILLVGVAGALGDAGSPASDSTLGPTSGLNADGQHNHIWDTCVPTFIAYDIILIIGGVIGAILL